MLDAHVSGPRVGRALEEMGHDVRAVDQEKDIDRLPDEQLFELAISDSRVLVTHNGKDYLRILKERPPEKSHSGLVLISYPIRLANFGMIIRGVQRTLGDLSQEEWINQVEWVRKEE